MIGGNPTDERIKKVLRTIQSEFPVLKRPKNCFYLHSRRLLRIPHESDFKALSLIPPTLKGCYVDVGANQGQSIESILLYRPEARIVSFEANRDLADRLAARYKNQPNVQIVAKGLSDSPGQFVLFIPSYMGFVYDALASFNRGSAVYTLNKETLLGFDPMKLTLAEYECTVETMDMQHLEPVFIKVDVEGYTYKVLYGARETLKKYEPILLVENFRGDPRNVEFAKELAYEEYYFDGSSLRKGKTDGGPNSFLMTDSIANLLLR